MQVSVIILNYNVKYFLENCILSVQKAISNIKAEIIVIDNNSTDGSCELIAEKYPSVTLIQNKENYGFSKGNNIGIAQAQGDFIYILNPDTVIAEDSILKLINFYNSTPNVGAIGSKMIDGRGQFLPESKRGVPTPWVSLCKFFSLHKFFPRIKAFNNYYQGFISPNAIAPVEILSGANMFLKRELFNSIGGFDENYFMYAEDTDLSYCITKLGYNNYYFPENVIIHYKGESTIKDKIYIKHFNDAIQLFYRKHFKASLIFDLLMQIGAILFLFIKPKIKNENINVSNYLLISENIALRQEIEMFFKKNVIQIGKIDKIKLNSQLKKLSDNTQIIFDANDFSYLEIISTMEYLKKTNITFKIHPINSDFIIGSNNSLDRGEVYNFSQNNITLHNQKIYVKV